MKLPGQYPRWADFLAFLFWNWLFTQGLGAKPRFWVVTETRHVLRSKYRGTCQLTAAQGQVGVIPIHLKVWNFTLPPVPALETEFGSPAARLRGYYRERAKAGPEAEPTNWAAVDTECAQVLSDHRLNAVPTGETIRPVSQPDGSLRIRDHYEETFLPRACRALS